MGFGPASNRAVANNTPNKIFTNRTSAYTVTQIDDNKIINCTSGSFTVSLTTATTLRTGFYCEIWNSSTTASHIITIDPYGSETIDGVSTILLQRGEGITIISDGTNWQIDSNKGFRVYAENVAPTILRPTATGSSSLALGYDEYHATVSASSGINSLSFAGTASGDYSVSLGATASGLGAIAIGTVRATTKTNTAANYSLALGGDSTGAYGATINSTGTGSVALGGSYTSGVASFAAINEDTSGTYGAKGDNSVAIGKQVLASGTASVALGLNSSAVQLGKMVFASGRFSTNGDAQIGMMILRNTTTTNTATVLTSDAGTASASNQIILPNDSTYFFRVNIVARRTDADNEGAAYIFEGCIDRNTSAGTTALIGGSSKQVLAEDSSVWDVSLSADTTFGGLAVTVTGENTKTIKWVAMVQTVEVTG